MYVAEAQRLNRLEDENRRLKQLVADLSLDKEALKSVIQKNGWSLPALRAEVAFIEAEHGLSERRACKLLGMERSTYRYEPRAYRNVGCVRSRSSWRGRSLAMATDDCTLS